MTLYVYCPDYKAKPMIQVNKRKYVLFDKSFIKWYLYEYWRSQWQISGYSQASIRLNGYYYNLQTYRDMTFQLTFYSKDFQLTTNDIYVENYIEDGPESAIKLIRDTIHDMLLKTCCIASLFCNQRGICYDLSYEICKYINS